MASADIPTIEPKSGATSTETWKRGAFMFAFMFLFGMGQSLLYMTAVIQFFWLLFANEPNGLLLRFGTSLALWLADAARFLSCASETKPFPFTDWPRAG